MPEQKAYITVQNGMTGWFAVLMTVHPEGFHEPWNTGYWRHATKDEALQEAMEWALAEDLDMVVLEDLEVAA